MLLAPIAMMLQRVQRNGPDSEFAKFHELLYLGELVIKLTTAAFVAAVEDDVDRHRYRLIHGLVRADGIGDWCARLDDVVSGLASQHLSQAFFDDRRELNERVGEGTWQYDAVGKLQEVLIGVQPSTPPIPSKFALRLWFAKFAEIRNKTRGHGATTPAKCAALSPALEHSLKIFIENTKILSRPWAYLHRNLSGKYRVIELGGDQKCFSRLRSSSTENLANGVYMWGDSPRLVELVHTDLNVSDFFVPNGDFNGKTFELLSLITDGKSRADAAPYLAVAGDRPPSETDGKSELDIIGQVLSNVPSIPRDYIRRRRLELEVRNAIINDRHPIITLVGRGGIGKTSLALTVLHEIAQLDRFSLILWFSARDVDLTVSGPKVVKPSVLTEREIAEQYLYLTGSPNLTREQRVEAVGTMAKDLGKNPSGATLFVFDNFETVRSPIDLFQWLDTHIRLPNKIVITSRFRDFKADLPIEVHGMEQDEAEELVASVCTKLNVQISNSAHRDQIIEDSSGHPYIIKIVLGEIAVFGSYSKPSNLLARKDDILEALFERTYLNLAPLAVQLFLTLSGWKSLVPQIAVEATVLRHGEESADPEEAIDQLVRMSLVDRTRANDGNDFLSVPLTAALFGRKKLEVSPHRDVIESDIRFLTDIGATSKSALKDGIRPRIAALFRNQARRIEENKTSLESSRPVLEFVARQFSPAWLLLADLELEIGGAVGREMAIRHLSRFLEGKPAAEAAQPAWQQLINIYRARDDVRGACNALLRSAEAADPPLEQISNLANWLNTSRDIIANTEVVDREALFRPLAALMERHLTDASATYLSRLAWLHLHAGDDNRALAVAEMGLEREPDNSHCQRLVERITFSAR